MPTASELMTSEVSTLTPDMSLREAVERLDSQGISGAPVVSGPRVIGVLSRTDLLDFQATSPGVPSFRETGEGLGRWDPAEIWDEDAEDDPSAYFADFWDDPGASLRERFNAPGTPEWDVLEEHTVDEIMTPRVVAVAPETDIVEAARTMLKAGVHRVLVIEDDELRGILSGTDLIRAIAQGKLG